MSATIGWVGPHRDLYDEAVRVIPALAVARHRDQVRDATVLYHGYLDDARRLGVPDGMAWLVFSTAAVMWVSQLAHAKADIVGADVDDVLIAMVDAAAGWAGT